MISELIRNREKAKQILAFDGMKYGKCSPTDIDVSMDWQGKTFVFVEMKGRGAPLTLGQRLHLEGLCKAIVAGGKHAYAILAVHDEPNTEQDVEVAICEPLRIFDGKEWKMCGHLLNLQGTIAKLYSEHIERNT